MASTIAQGSTGPPSDTRVVLALMEAFNRRDVEAALVCTHPSFRLFPVTARAMGRDEPFVGPDGMREYMETTEREWDELQITPIEVQQAGDAVIVIGEARGRAAGGELHSVTIWTWKLRDGLAVECRVHADTAEARAAIGLIARA